MNVLEVKQLQIMREQRVIIDNLSFELPEGYRLFLQGDIGCGKSTLLHCLLGFIPHQQGEIRWFDNLCRQEKDFVPLRGKIGICFQHAGDQLFGPTVLDDVAFGPLNQGLNRDEAYQIALQQLERLNIVGLKDRSVNTLSGGETFLASMALALGLADVIQSYAGGIHMDTMFIDEGFGTLDPDTLELAMETLVQLQSSGRLIGMISHVPELKTRIPAHLEVTRGDEGSTAKFVIN